MSLSNNNKCGEGGGGGDNVPAQRDLQTESEQVVSGYSATCGQILHLHGSAWSVIVFFFLFLWMGKHELSCTTLPQ